VGVAKFLGGLLLLTAAFGQDRPLTQIHGEPEEVLVRAREKILAVAERLPRYTCVETISRDYFEVPAKDRGKMMSAQPAPACSVTLDHPATGLVRVGSDRLRLEVAVAGNREIESWPGASRFDSRRIDEIVKFGPTSTGSFGTYLIEVFENPGAKIEFSQEKSVAGRRVFEYQFHIPFEASHYKIKAAGEWRITASSGSLRLPLSQGTWGTSSSRPTSFRPTRRCARRRLRSPTNNCGSARRIF
jgi:hypothetical protein